jgi:hypothetical protein
MVQGPLERPLKHREAASGRHPLLWACFKALRQRECLSIWIISQQSRPLSPTIAFLNIRLGRWVQRPERQHSKRNQRIGDQTCPLVSPRPLMSSLRSRTKGQEQGSAPHLERHSHRQPRRLSRLLRGAGAKAAEAVATRAYEAISIDDRGSD